VWQLGFWFFNIWIIRMKASATVFALLVLAVASPRAQDKPVLSTREELRACLAEGDRIDEEKSALDLAQRRVDSAQKDLQALSKAQAAMRAGVNRRDAAAVEAFNKKVQVIRDLGVKLNDQANKVVERSGELSARIDAINLKCAGMTLASDDYQAVLLERVKRAAAQ
jgi:hypothetical protein